MRFSKSDSTSAIAWVCAFRFRKPVHCVPISVSFRRLSHVLATAQVTAKVRPAFSRQFPARRTCLEVEALEDRCVPSTAYLATDLVSDQPGVRADHRWAPGQWLGHRAQSGRRVLGLLQRKEFERPLQGRCQWQPDEITIGSCRSRWSGDGAGIQYRSDGHGLRGPFGNCQRRPSLFSPPKAAR